MYGHPTEEELMRLLDGDPAIVYVAAEHVEECSDCRRRLDSIRTFRTALSDVLRPQQDREVKKALLVAKIEQDTQRAKQISGIVDAIIRDAKAQPELLSESGMDSRTEDVSQETGRS